MSSQLVASKTSALQALAAKTTVKVSWAIETSFSRNGETQANTSAAVTLDTEV